VTLKKGFYIKLRSGREISPVINNFSKQGLAARNLRANQAEL
jgi:hypothetical protein